jgi:hypothetical protein
MDKPLENYPRILAGQRPQTLGELFSKPSRWIKGTDAKNAQGAGCEIRNPGAVQWCIGGGTRLIYGDSPEKIQEVHAKFKSYMEDQLGLTGTDLDSDEIDPDAVPDMATWNDNESRTFKELRAMLKATGI